MPEIPEMKGADSIIDNLIKIITAIGKSGVAVVIFAFPSLMGCFGLYFMWIALNDSQVSTAKISAGIFATIFGSGLSILLIFVFSRMELWDTLGLSKVERQNGLTVLGGRVKALEDKVTELSTRKAVA